MSVYPPDLEEYIEKKVRSGQFRSRDELAAEALRVYRELEEKHELLKADVRAALSESARGESEPLDIEQVKRELELGLEADDETA